jgi:hypothetical protein
LCTTCTTQLAVIDIVSGGDEDVGTITANLLDDHDNTVSVSKQLSGAIFCKVTPAGT